MSCFLGLVRASHVRIEADSSDLMSVASEGPLKLWVVGSGSEAIHLFFQII